MKSNSEFRHNSRLFANCSVDNHTVTKVINKVHIMFQ